MAIKKKITEELIKRQINKSNIKQRNDQKEQSVNLDSVIPPIRINKKHKKILEKHFKTEKGLTLSSGIRMLIFEYMQNNHLI